MRKGNGLTLTSGKTTYDELMEKFIIEHGAPSGSQILRLVWVIQENTWTSSFQVPMLSQIDSEKVSEYRNWRVMIRIIHANQLPEP